MQSAVLETASQRQQQEVDELQKGVKHLTERDGLPLQKLPNRYILPVQDRPNTESVVENATPRGPFLSLPVIDLAQLLGAGERPNRVREIARLREACESYGFFQLVNHEVSSDTALAMAEVCRGFFDLPFEERERYMSADMRAPVRYGTSVNQLKDGVLCWRDFLKLLCDYSPDVISQWPSSPQNLRDVALAYSKEMRRLFLVLMDAILQSLIEEDHHQGVVTNEEQKEDDTDGSSSVSTINKEFEQGSQLMVVNCYPPCPQPELTLGMPPHSDYGFLTLLRQDQLVKGLQIQHQGEWVTVEPIPGAFLVNVGDHLEIFSNGRYKSVLHRALVNSEKTRITVVSLHSFSFDRTVMPWRKLVHQHDNPRRYKDTNFAAFLDYISSGEPKKKNFLESRKITL